MLHTIVDVAVTQQHTVYGGGGADDVHVQVDVTALLNVSKAEVADIADRRARQQDSPTGKPGPAAVQKQPAVQQQQQQQLQQQGTETQLLLPVPWASGSEAVRLVAVVAHRRRVAKLLLFIGVVPEGVPALPVDGRAKYLRRLWRCPDTGQPAEVQLIAGKTLERSLVGAWAL